MKNTHGGKRPNSGRKKMAEADKKTPDTVNITIRVKKTTLAQIDIDRGAKPRGPFIMGLAGYGDGVYEEHRHVWVQEMQDNFSTCVKCKGIRKAVSVE